MSKKHRNKQSANEMSQHAAESEPERVETRPQEPARKRDDGPPVPIERSDPNFDAREKLAEELFKKESAEQEGGEEDTETTQPEVDDSDDHKKPQEAEEAEGDQAEAEEIQGDGAETEAAEEEYETLIVDGTETKKTKKEVYEAGKRALQKDMSADKRLEEATRLLKEAQATVGYPRQDADHQYQPAPPVPDQDQQKKIKALYEKLRYGDDDEGEKALAEVLSTGRGNATPQVDMNQVFYGVGLLLEQDKIKNAFTTDPEKGGYADILPTESGGKCTDPEVWGYFDYKLNQLLMEGQPNALPTYKQAAEIVRKRFVGTGQQRPVSLSEKREKKGSIDVVKGVRSKTPSAVQPEKEETQDDIIKWHRKQRGQG